MPSWIYPYNYELGVDLSKLLIINNKKQLMQFHKEYHQVISEYISVRSINWKLVASRYSGVEINPYLWECRLLPEVLWFYGWDCASGCIWNKGAILSVRKLMAEEVLEKIKT